MNLKNIDRKFHKDVSKIVESEGDPKNETFDNWVMHDNETLQSDFNEYKHKEYKKWKSRAERVGFRFPIFDTFEDYKNGIYNGKVIELTPDTWNKVEHLTMNTNLQDLRNMIQSYTIPREIDKIIQGIENNEPIPYPVILKGNNGLFIMSGNTRLNVARIMGATPKALLVNVSE